MKRIFLIPLLTLLCTVMAWGVNVAKIQVDGKPDAFATDLADLNSKIAALEDSATITLLADINVTNEEDNVTLIVGDDKHVLLNLAGHGITQTWKLKNTSGGGCTYEWKPGTPDWVKEDYTPETAAAESGSEACAYAPALCPANYVQEVCGGGDINVNALIYNAGSLRIISEGNKIVQMTIGTREDGADPESPTTICNAGNLVVEGGIFIGPNGGFDLPKLPVIWVKNNDAVTTIKGGTFLCYEGVSDAHKGPDMGPLRGGVAENWHISGGIFSTDEMAGTPMKKNGGGDNTKYSTEEMFENDDMAYKGYLESGYEAVEVPYTNANIDGYTEEFRRTRYSSYVNEYGEHIGDQVVTGEGQNYTKIVYNGICPDPVKMRQRDEADRMYCYNDLYADRSKADGSIQYVQTESHATDSVYYERYRYAIKPVCVVVPTGTTESNFLFVQPNETITVANGETLRKSSIVMGDATSKIIVEAGGKLISEGEIVTSTPDNLELTMDAVNNKYAQLMIKPNAIQDKHPDATVVLKSKAYKKDGAYTWQRFAVPTYLDGDQSLTRANMLYDNTNYKTALYRWDYESTQENKWTAMDNNTDKFTPFDCYELTTSNTTKGGEYTFKCELVGNGDANLQLDNDRWSYFANSYTAPINIKEMLWELFMNATYKDNIAASVYVHNRTDENWDLVSFADVLDEKVLAHNNIDPMQAFVLWKIADIEDYTLHYEDVIYNPAMGNTSNLHPAPARRAQAGMDYQRASIVFSDENGKKDIVKLYEGSDFDNTLNNGFDVEKLMNEGQFNAYIAAEEGEMARIASDSIENATIAMQTKEATTFSMSFENVTLEGYAVRDNLTGTTTEIKEGNIYHFTTPANAVVEGRFQVVAMPKITTAVENVENATATKGIYTLTGIYMGEDFNAVPAGIYIVNGKKMVK